MAAKNMLLTLRTAAIDCQDALIRFNLDLVANELEEAIETFRLVASEENLRRMVGHWAHGQLMMNYAGQKRTPCATDVPLQTTC